MSVVGDIIQGLGVRVSADTSPAISGLDRLERSSGKVASAFDKMKSSLGESIDHAIDTFGKLNQAIEGVDKIIRGLEWAGEMVKFAAEARQLEKDLPVGALQAMTRATEGTVDKLSLLRFGVKAMRGDMSLTKEGLELVTAAASNLSSQGFGETIEIAQKLDQAIRSGSVHSLAEFGITIQDTSDKQKALNELMQKMQEIAATPVEVDPQLKAVQQLQAATQDWIDNMKEGLGDVLGWTLQALDAISDALAGITDHKGKYMTDAQMMDAAHSSAYEDVMARHPEAATNGVGITADIGAEIEAESHARFEKLRARRDGTISKAQTDERAKKAGLVKTELPGGYEVYLPPAIAARLSARKTGVFVNGQFKGADVAYGVTDGYLEQTMGSERAADNLKDWIDTDGPLAASFGGVAPGMTSDQYDEHRTANWEDDLRLKTEAEASIRERAEQAAIGNAAERKDLKSHLGISGNSDASLETLRAMKDVMDELNDSTTGAGMAFGTFEAGFSSMIDAAISGNESLGKAFAKGAMAKAKSIAIEATLDAAKYGYMALAALAMGEPAAASAFGTSAAEALATAALAGGAAVALSGIAGGGGGGGGGASPHSAPGGGYVGAGGSTGGGDGPTNVTVIVNGYVGQQRELGEVMVKAIDSAKRSGRVRDGSGVVTME
jgi:hypothetical protein